MIITKQKQNLYSNNELSAQQNFRAVCKIICSWYFRIRWHCFFHYYVSPKTVHFRITHRVSDKTYTFLTKHSCLRSVRTSGYCRNNQSDTQLPLLPLRILLECFPQSYCSESKFPLQLTRWMLRATRWVEFRIFGTAIIQQTEHLILKDHLKCLMTPTLWVDCVKLDNKAHQA